LIDPEDLIVPGNPSIHNRLAIEAPAAFDRATEEIIAARLSQLESNPVVGAYDATHFQHIHERIFEGVFPWAGKLREPQSSDLTSSLDVLFDKLARENRLKGLDGDAWLKRSTEYFSELSAIEPFIGGNELASLEFFRQLASENNMTLRILTGMGEPCNDQLQSQLQTQSNNLRRILMLAVGPYPPVRPSRVLGGWNLFELTDPI
jgi:fido (protein-threonine AMPylation protein)